MLTKTIRIHWFTCCGCARCVLRTSGENMTLLHDVLNIKTFRILVNNSDRRTKNRLSENMKLILKYTNLAPFGNSPTFWLWPWIIFNFDIIHITQSCSDPSPFSKAYGDNSYFFKRCERLQLTGSLRHSALWEMRRSLTRLKIKDDLLKWKIKLLQSTNEKLVNIYVEKATSVGEDVEKLIKFGLSCSIRMLLYIKKTIQEVVLSRKFQAII